MDFIENLHVSHSWEIKDNFDKREQEQISNNSKWMLSDFKTKIL